MKRQHEVALAALHEEHARRIAKLTEEHDKEIRDTKERNFELQKKLEKLETSDLVKAVGKGAKIPQEISEEDRCRLEKGLREQDTLIEAYQKENQRLFDECKAAQAGARDKDHHLFIENQRLQQRNKVLEEEVQQLVLRSSQQAGGDLASKVAMRSCQHSRVMLNPRSLYRSPVPKETYVQDLFL